MDTVKITALARVSLQVKESELTSSDREDLFSIVGDHRIHTQGVADRGERARYLIEDAGLPEGDDVVTWSDEILDEAYREAVALEKLHEEIPMSRPEHFHITIVDSSFS